MPPSLDTTGLARLLHPRSIAVIGASPDDTSFAGRTLANLQRFAGTVWRVNPRHARIGEHPCWPEVGSLPDVPDLAVVSVGRDRVEEVTEACGAAGVGAAIVYASGFAETGRPEDIELQQRLLVIARRTGLRLVGPNCIGIVDVGSGALATFSAVPALPPPSPHAVGLVCQSGALAFAMAQAAGRGASFSHLLACGNSADVDVADLIEALVNDASCRSIACTYEGIAEPERLYRAARAARAAGKPLAILRLGKTKSGRQAAAAHTAAPAGDPRAERAALQACGAVCIAAFEDLVPTAAFLAKAGRPRAKGAAVVAVSGGAAILAADAAESEGVHLPQPSPETQVVLASCIPVYGSARNPCDVTAQVLNDPASLAACARSLLEDEVYGVLVHPAPWASDQMPGRMAAFSALAAAARKPVCVVWLSQWLEGPGCAEVERDPHLALFHSIDGCMRAIREWTRPVDATVAQVGGASD